MDKIHIQIHGNEYPCRLSYKAFKELESSFKPLAQMQQKIEDTAKLFYCGVKAASQADGVKFTLSFDEFETWLDDNFAELSKFRLMQNEQPKAKKGEGKKNAKSPLA